MPYRLPMGIRANLRNVNARPVPGENQQSVQQNNVQQNNVQQNNLNRSIQTVQNPTQELVNLRKQFEDQKTEINDMRLAQRKSEVLSGSQKALVGAEKALNILWQAQFFAFKKRDDLDGIKSSIGKMQSNLKAILSNTKIVQDDWSQAIDDLGKKVAELQKEIKDLSSRVAQQEEVKGYELPQDVQNDAELKNSVKQLQSTKTQIDQAKIATQEAIKKALCVCDKINNSIDYLKNLAKQVAEKQKEIKENTERANEFLKTINGVEFNEKDNQQEAWNGIRDAISANKDLLNSDIDVNGVDNAQSQAACTKLKKLANWVAASCDTEMDDINNVVQKMQDSEDEEQQKLLDDVKSKLLGRENSKHYEEEHSEITVIHKGNEKFSNVLNESLKRGFSNIPSAEKSWHDVSVMLKQIEQNSAKLEGLQKISAQLQQPAQLKQTLEDLRELLRYSGFVTIVDNEENDIFVDPIQQAMKDADNVSVDYDNF